jgi:hypothetical protein
MRLENEGSWQVGFKNVDDVSDLPANSVAGLVLELGKAIDRMEIGWRRR